MGKGLDIGTVNLVAAIKNSGSKIEIHKQRNAFLETSADSYTKNFLSKLDVPYVVQNDNFYVLGDDAFELANVLNKEIRRPMKEGMISPREAEAIPIMKLLIENILGRANPNNEVCYYSVPADPIDTELNVVYHQEVFNKLLVSLGYKPKSMVEGHAVVLSELAEEDFTGIAISCGGGMFNICVAYKSIPCIVFSTSRGGDWIDENAAKVLAMKPARISMIKEKGIDLSDTKNREEEAIAIYYKSLIKYTLEAIRDKFEVSQDLPQFPDAVSLVLAGGTSMATGFDTVVKQELERIKFPIAIKDVRVAREPLTSVAKGALAAATLDEEDMGTSTAATAPAKLEQAQPRQKTAA